MYNVRNPTHPLLSAEWNINNESVTPDIFPIGTDSGLHSVKQRRKYWEKTTV